ncbi:hypothetical protein GCM10007939_19380 [Amylibacter marinus]|uniref:Hemin uptake protein HemP n=1 Tax=Amylibacter marinus TaxID=1475483 RepID=A0ABQ5VWD0_9RHOB|nr:hemin uptake protein HemP [Amylibacter marinus]GLQ35655.1 hypothetical protein GCM10007939_19380 [Amylibacter marinus]
MSIHNLPNKNTATPLAHIPNYDAKELTRQGPLATIQLDEKVYTLRITRQGKLILTK